jgi:hypothetical protein
MVWNVKGTITEGCASEGQCPLILGRDMEKPCKSFLIAQIKEGKIDNVDIGGTLVIAVADLFSGKAADLPVKGGEGGIYISNNTTEEQRKLLQPFLVNNIPGFLITKKCLGVKFVDINLSQQGNDYHATMPYGELKGSVMMGGDGKTPQRLENLLTDACFSNVKVCNTHFWKYKDFHKNFKFTNRSGFMAEFNLKGD